MYTRGMHVTWSRPQLRYVLRQIFLYELRQFSYYELRQLYYELRQLLLLRSATNCITNCDNFITYYDKLLRIATVITKCDSAGGGGTRAGWVRKKSKVQLA